MPSSWMVPALEVNLGVAADPDRRPCGPPLPRSLRRAGRPDAPAADLACVPPAVLLEYPGPRIVLRSARRCRRRRPPRPQRRCPAETLRVPADVGAAGL